MNGVDSIKLSPTLCLSDVLHVIVLTCNFFSISKLITALYSVNFYEFGRENSIPFLLNLQVYTHIYKLYYHSIKEKIITQSLKLWEKNNLFPIYSILVR